MQLDCQSVASLPDHEVRPAMERAMDLVDRAVEGVLGWVGPAARLVVLPEYVLSGYPAGPLERWRELVAARPEGWELERLGDLARRLGVWLAANLYERDPLFPVVFFQSSLVLSPEGSVALRYRRLHSLYTPTPHDLWGQYLEAYGWEGVLPVVDTELGRLAAVASEEILFPELARVLAWRGAEVFVHSTSEASGQPRPKDHARVARAVENLAYVVSANTASVAGTAVPKDAAGGGSQVVDPEGRVLAQAGPGETFCDAPVDLAGLRARRAAPGMHNLPARLRNEVYAPFYATPVHPGGWLGGAVTLEAAALRDAHRKAVGDRPWNSE